MFGLAPSDGPFPYPSRQTCQGGISSLFPGRPPPAARGRTAAAARRRSGTPPAGCPRRGLDVPSWAGPREWHRAAPESQAPAVASGLPLRQLTNGGEPVHRRRPPDLRRALERVEGVALGHLLLRDVAVGGEAE